MVNNPTHKVTITIISSEDDPDVTMKVSYDPFLDDVEIQQQGYLPAAYQLADRFIDSALVMVETAQLLEIEPGDLDAKRSIN